MRRIAASICLLTAVLPLGGCGVWFFSGDRWIDQTQPVAAIETTGGVEYGATTELGVLLLGRTASDGPCRVRYLLGDAPLVESGELHAVGGGFVQADIELKTQWARLLDRPPEPRDELLVMWTPDGERIERCAVELASGEGLAGDLLQDPGIELPAGATVLCEGHDGRPQFVGLIAGRATVDGGPAAGRYYVFAGVDRVRELLAVPQRHPQDKAPKYRLDDISVMRPIEAQAKPAEPDPGTPGLPMPLVPNGARPDGGQR